MASRDFTLRMYENLLIALTSNQYKSVVSDEYLKMRDDLKNLKIVLLRHDIDKNTKNAIQMAELEWSYRFRGIYYFRNIHAQFDQKLIKAVAALNHEIGYHYEVLSRTKGNFEKAIQLFAEELKQLRQIAPVRTICMHGAPWSKWDNRKLWEKYDYHDYEVHFEPYFDLDFNEVFYLTDTGRGWNKKGVSLRDKVSSRYEFRLESTRNVIDALHRNRLPDQLMINCHPQRWNVDLFPWLRELIWQNTKNLIKNILTKSMR